MSETGRFVIGVVIGLLFIALLRFFLLEKWQRFCQKRAMRRGNKLEKEAARFLRSKGYEILKPQFELAYSVWEDNIERNIKITPDYLVGRNGKKYLVEVKSGKQAPAISYAPTRRQLLEYVVAAKADGIFLLDMEKRILKKVQFDLITETHQATFVWVVIAVLFPTSALFVVDVWWRYGMLLCGVLTLLIVRQLLKRKR